MLEKLRSKPDYIKKNISLVLTVFIFSVIVLIWLSSWDARNNGGETREKTLSPFSGVIKVFQGMITDMQNGIFGTTSNTENTLGVGTTTPAPAGTRDFDMSGVVILEGTASTTSQKSF